MPSSPAQLQQAQRQVTSLASADLMQLQGRVSSFDDARSVLPPALGSLVETYGSISAAHAAEWYDGARGTMPKPFTATPAVITENATQELVDWAVSTGFNLGAVFQLVDGGLSRRILDWGRKTIVDATEADPMAEGWIRVGRPSHCEWCTQYLDGVVHNVEGYDFPAHDHCHCFTVPAFTGKPKPNHLITA